MNDEEIKQIIKAEAAHAGNVIGGAIILLAVCILVVGVCIGVAWIMASVR
jgi:hypothetical protein